MANTTSYYNYLNPNKTSNSGYSPTQSTSSLYGNLLKSTAAGTGLGSILGTVIGSPIIGTALGGLYGATSGLLSGTGSSGATSYGKSGTEAPTQGAQKTKENNSYTPSASPTMMTWDAALAQAKSQVDPQYNEQRSQLEQLYRDKAEQAPQLRAARGGLTRLNSYGGIGEEKGEITQDQAAKIDSLENSRQAAINSLASEIRNGEYDNALQKWQAQEQANYNAYQTAYQKSRDKILDQQTNESSAWERALAQAGFNRQLGLDDQTQSNWEKNFDWDKQQYLNSPEGQDWYLDYYKNGLNLDNRLKEAQVASELAQADKYSRSGYGTSGRSSSSGYSGKSVAERQAQATGEAINGVKDMAASGKSYMDIYNFLMQNRGTLTANGADMKSVSNYLDTIKFQIPYK